jgi:hypothetical protein
MAHNHPRANQFYRYCKHTAKGSVADAFRQFDESIPDTLTLRQDNERRYKDFCLEARTNKEWRYMLFANAKFRYRREFER